MFKQHEVDINNWHYRVVCKLCGFHKPFEYEPTGHDIELLLCHECNHLYPEEWDFGIYKLVSDAKWYNPLSWGKKKWINKLLESA